MASESRVVMQSEIFSHEGELVWSVSQLSKFDEAWLSSNEFSIVPNCKVTWEICLSLDKSVHSSTVEIRRTDEILKPVSATIQCEFENSKGEKYRFEEMDTTFDDNDSKPFSRTTDSQAMETWNFDNYTHKCHLIVKCQIKLNNCCSVTKPVEKCNYNTSLLRSRLPMDLFSGFERLYTERLYTDVILKVGEMSYPAHKAILCIRSPYFRTIFETDMIESQTGVVNIVDEQPKIVEAFLLYLYTDSIVELPMEDICGLYTVGVKYKVPSLQDKCRSVLLVNLNVKTFCQAMKLADLHNDYILKGAVLKYILDNFPSLRHTTEFKQLRDEDSGLVLDSVLATVLDFYLKAPKRVDPRSASNSSFEFEPANGPEHPRCPVIFEF